MALQAGHATLGDDQHLLRMTPDGEVEAVGLPSRFNVDPAIAAYAPRLRGLSEASAYYAGAPR